MKPTQIQIQNFLSYEDSGKVDLDSKTILVGENNAGKSNFIEAVQEFFRFSNRARQDLGNFYNRDEDREIQITVWFDNLSDEEKEKFKNGVDVPEAAELAVRLKSEYDSEENRAETNDYQLLVPDSESTGTEWSKETKLADRLSDCLPEISHYGAERDLDDAAKTSNKSSLLYKLLGSAYEEIPDEDTEELEKFRGELKTNLEQTPKPIADLMDNLDEMMGRQVSIDGNLDIEFEVPTVKEMVRRHATIRSGEDQEDTLRDMGSGSQMSFVLSCIWETANRDTEDVFLTLEEPENYLHPHSIRELHTTLDELSGDGDFVLLTTHSPELAGPRDLEYIRRVECSNGKSKVEQPGGQIQERDIQVLEATQSSESKEMFFSRSLLVCEGPSDREVFQIANNILAEGDGDIRTFDAEGVTVLNAGGKGSVPAYLRVATAFGIPTIAVLDTDADRDTDPKKVDYGTIRECKQLSDRFKMLNEDLERALFENVSLGDFHDASGFLSDIGIIEYDYDMNGIEECKERHLETDDDVEVIMHLYDGDDWPKPALGRELANRCDINSFSGDLQDVIANAVKLAK